MNVRQQYGHLRSVQRKVGPHAWEYLWRETDQSGKRVRSTLRKRNPTVVEPYEITNLLSELESPFRSIRT
jgi:hypothetical protein